MAHSKDALGIAKLSVGGIRSSAAAHLSWKRSLFSSLGHKWPSYGEDDANLGNCSVRSNVMRVHFRFMDVIVIHPPLSLVLSTIGRHETIRKRCSS